MGTAFVFWSVTDLTYNTLAAGFLTLGFVLGLWVVVGGRGWRYALAAGVCHALAVIAYPTLLFIMPFVAIAFVLAQGRQAAAMIAGGHWSTAYDPRPDDPPTGLPARKTLIAYALGGAVPLLICAALVVVWGTANVVRSWHYTMEGAGVLHQLGGAGKAFVVARGLLEFLGSQPILLVGLVAAYLVFRWRPRVGRLLLLLLPGALFMAGERPHVSAAGFVLVYGLLAPYLYLFIPRVRREMGAKMLIWVWVPAMVAAAMTGYTSSAGFAHGATGLYPALVVSGLFVAWALLGEPAADAGAARGAWLAFAGLAAIVAVLIVFQFQYQIGGVSYGRLTKAVNFGPWLGVRATPASYRFLQEFRTDLAHTAKPGDRLLIYFKEPGLYFFWPGKIAANSTLLNGTPHGDALAPIPTATVEYWRRQHVVPDVVVHLCQATHLDAATLQRCGGLQYPTALVRAAYSVNVRPAAQSTAEVLARLPRLPR